MGRGTWKRRIFGGDEAWETGFVHRDLPPPRRAPWRVAIAVGFVLLALAGEWAAHATTWYLTGGATPGQALSGASHTYLGPAGVLIAVLAAGASWLVWRGLRRLGEVARSIESSARRAWRFDPRRLPAEGLRGSGPDSDLGDLRFTPVWAALIAVQVVVYLVQENVESRAAGHGLPGLHVLTVHHGSALLAHAVLALLGAAIAVELVDRWQARSQKVTVAVAAYRAVTWRRSRVPCDPPAALGAAATPLLLVGRSILSRPPPSLLSV
jgi:hypothetical protein